jgi:hypothetical protein
VGRALLAPRSWSLQAHHPPARLGSACLGPRRRSCCGRRGQPADRPAARGRPVLLVSPPAGAGQAARALLAHQQQQASQPASLPAAGIALPLKLSSVRGLASPRRPRRRLLRRRCERPGHLDSQGRGSIRHALLSQRAAGRAGAAAPASRRPRVPVQADGQLLLRQVGGSGHRRGAARRCYCCVCRPRGAARRVSPPPLRLLLLLQPTPTTAAACSPSTLPPLPAARPPACALSGASWDLAAAAAAAQPPTCLYTITRADAALVYMQAGAWAAAAGLARPPAGLSAGLGPCTHASGTPSSASALLAEQAPLPLLRAANECCRPPVSSSCARWAAAVAQRAAAAAVAKLLLLWLLATWGRWVCAAAATAAAAAAAAHTNHRAPLMGATRCVRGARGRPRPCPAVRPVGCVCGCRSSRANL